MAGVIRGAVSAELLRGYGYGYGNGYGYGDGYGNGYGYGDGYGYGNGNGDGDGYGYGDGDGYGYGNGDGDGYGYGNGNGYGDGDGDGDGDGNGNGYGDGYGYGDGNYWLAAIPTLLPPEYLPRIDAAKAVGATIAFWKSDGDGKPCNGGSGQAAMVGAVQTVAGPLQLCARGTLHATANPSQWKGERLWIVALHGEVVSDGEKFGALRREILGEVAQPGKAVA